MYIDTAEICILTNFVRISLQQTTEAIANCIAAHECLERANFADFWARATGPLFESGDVKKRVRNCTFFSYYAAISLLISWSISDAVSDLVLAVITDIVAKTYRVISVEQYSALVNLKDAELKAYISDLAAAGWKQVDNNLQIPTEAGTVKPKPTTEVLQFDQFTKLLAPLR